METTGLDELSDVGSLRQQWARNEYQVIVLSKCPKKKNHTLRYLGWNCKENLLFMGVECLSFPLYLDKLLTLYSSITFPRTPVLESLVCLGL